MSEKHAQQYESSAPGTSRDMDDCMNWDLCIFCQTSSNEPLQCPAKSTRKDVGAGYKYVNENLLAFAELGEMPFNINLTVLDTGRGMENTLSENCASWHKSCRNKISNEKLERAHKRKTAQSVDLASPIKTRRQSDISSKVCKDVCFFCDAGGSAVLHKASTFELDFKVRKYAEELQDRNLIAKLASGDMVAIEAKYHVKCLASFYKKAQKHEQESREESDEGYLQSIAFAELVSYLETCRDSSDTRLVFRMSDLKNLYSSRIKELGATEKQIHTTRFKIRICAAIPDLKPYFEGRDLLFAFDKDVGVALKQVCQNDFDSEALVLAKAAKIIRRDVFSQKLCFDGTFPEDCQRDSVPSSLSALVSMMLDGPGIKEQSNLDVMESRIAQNISQLIVFNTVKTKSQASENRRHRRDKETPLAIYLALKIHGETRKKGLVETLYNNGLCISYDRLQDISTDVANKVCTQYENEGVVCPPKLVQNVFTTAAVDNIDHNPSSTTAKDSFHGTGISLMQHPSNDNPGITRPVPIIDGTVQATTKVSALPSSYTNVPPLSLVKNDPLVPVLNVRPPCVSDPNEFLEPEYTWLDHAKLLLGKDEHTDTDFISWAAYHASLQSSYSEPTTKVALLPLFLENAHSAAMIKHSMNIIKDAVKHLNPNQIPVIVMDQPLYAIGKTIQWNFPRSHGEDSFLIMFGGLHIEMAAFKMLGDWLEGSGWTTAVANANITTSGVAESLVDASHLTRTRHVHQVTAVTLYILQHKAYYMYRENLPDDEQVLDFTPWTEKMKEDQPQFYYWAVVLELELCVLQFIASIRTGDFQLYRKSLLQLIPWVFSLDHINYARWLSVHIRDMYALEETLPEIYKEFCEGRFVAHKTKHPFSAIALDHAHEQVNAIVKGDGGAVGLTENVAALRRWMIAGPEISRMVEEYENVESDKEVDKHHEQTTSVQERFSSEVLSLFGVFDEFGNPFEEDSGDLLTIDSKDIVVEENVQAMKAAWSTGNGKYSAFLEERFVNQEKTIKDPIKKTQLALFTKKKSTQKQKTQLAALKDDRVLFSRLYIACQSREGNLEEFFKYENQPWPPSLSKFGEMRSGNKAVLMSVLEAEAESPGQIPTVSAVILDGAMIVQMLSPGTSKTFQEYSDTVFMPYIFSMLQNASRIDLVWDVYVNDSLKAVTREKRGKGQRRRVSASSLLPGNWQSFLRVNENKTELFHFLANTITSVNCDKEVNSTFDDKVLSSKEDKDKSYIEPCSHEEADTRLALHVADAFLCGHEKILVRTADTDVVVILLSHVNSMQVTELWISFGVGKHHRYIAAHEIATSLGPERAKALRFFHAFTGCDVTSFFAAVSKRTAYNVWCAFREVTQAFLDLSDVPEELTSEHMALLERFIVLLFDRTCELQQVNAARQYLFSKKSRSIENIPPTQASLRQHILRSAYQGGHVWGRSLSKHPDLPSPANWGWQRTADDVSWGPHWTTLDQAVKMCSELIHCGCKKSCRGLCKCYRASLKCTALCNCEGDCFQEV